MLRTLVLLLATLLLAETSIVNRAASGLRWRTKLLVERKQPMRVGVDVEIRSNDKGRGLYACRDIAEGELIGRYDGKHISMNEFESSDSSGTYAMVLANNMVVDGEDASSSSFVRYLNHSRRRANCISQDAWEASEGDVTAAVYLEAATDIAEGQELLFDYGSEYWDAYIGRFSPQRLVVDYF